jgi:hypothetical protein
VRRRPDTGGEYENRLVGSHDNQMLIIGTETRVEHAVGKRHFIDFAYLFNVKSVSRPRSCSGQIRRPSGESVGFPPTSRPFLSPL